MHTIDDTAVAEWLAGGKRNGTIPACARCSTMLPRPRVGGWCAKPVCEAWHIAGPPSQPRRGWEGSLYLATRHFAGWYMVNVLELPSEDVAIALGHTEGGELVRKLYGHRERERALDRVTAAYERTASYAQMITLGSLTSQLAARNSRRGGPKRSWSAVPKRRALPATMTAAATSPRQRPGLLP
jgi:hypothetical protein